MAEIAYRSQVRIERIKGSLRHAFHPEEPQPVHYGAQPGAYEPHATTIDYVVAAAAG